MTKRHDNDSTKAIFEAMRRVCDVLDVSGLSLDDQVMTLEIAWQAKAANARSAVLHIPDGFTTARADQIRHLEAMKVLVSIDEPDLELERLAREGDWDGVLEHLRKRRDAAEGGA